MSSTYIADVAQSLLDGAFAGLVFATTGRPPPSTVILTHGPPALEWCCDGGMLTVHLAEVAHRSPYRTENHPQVPCGVETRIRFVITSARCWPTMDSQGRLSSDAVAEAAADQLEDLWCLLTELYDRLAAKTLFPGQATCDDAEIGDVQPLDAEGGCAGWTVEVHVTPNDAGPLGS